MAAGKKWWSVTCQTAGRIDAKDHPNFGQITPESGRDDAKDHPNYGQVDGRVARRRRSHHRTTYQTLRTP